MTRIKTGLVLMAVGGCSLYFGGLTLCLFLLVVGCLAFYEIQQLSELKSMTLMVANMVCYAGVMLFFCLSFYRMIAPNVWALLQVHFVQWIGLGLVVVCFGVFFIEYISKQLLFRSYVVLNNLKFFLYITLGFGVIYIIRHIDGVGAAFTFLIFMVIWVTDVCAYYGGKRFGRHPLSPISPKKTIEGTLIGIVASMIATAIWVSAFDGGFLIFSQLGIVLMAGCIAAIAQFGDLYESLIKRTYNVKDSSNILPGHGGILDRADSTLFVAPLVFIMIILGS